MIEYPTVDDLVLINMIVIIQIRVKRPDRHRVLSYAKLEKIVADTKGKRGGIYDKAAVLLMGITKGHTFESANRRTAWSATKAFIRENGGRLRPRYKDGVLTGIREGFYTEEDVRNWLTGHEIKEFRRW